MKIGITEHGDIAFDNRWMKQFDEMDFNILISKSLPDDVGKQFMIDNSNKIIFHATTTGYGGTVIEPTVPEFEKRLKDLDNFCENGFPKSHVVIRVDPIIPTEEGLNEAFGVIQTAYDMGFCRFRYSFIDMYEHVKNRFLNAGLKIPTVNERFMKSWIFNIQVVFEGVEVYFETCAEANEYIPNHHKIGCISKRDLDVLGIIGGLGGTSNQRKNCLCPNGKTELLHHHGRCNFKCLYCYWQDN